MKLFLQKKMQNFRALVAPPSDPQNSPPPIAISGYAPVRNNFVLKHHRPKNMQRPKKSLKLFLRRYQNHSKSGFFYKNHQAKLMQRLKTRNKAL